MIKTPIEWNELAEDFLDADDCLITAEDVANALNTAADQSRVIEVMQMALLALAKVSGENPFPEQYGDGSVLLGMTQNDIYQIGFAEAFVLCQNAVENALAEAARIMEGK